MHITRILTVFSPLDVLVVTLEKKTIVKKSAHDTPVASLMLDKVEKFIMLGEFNTRNPTYWNVSGGKKKDEFENWEKALSIEIENSNLNVKVTDLDNSSDVVETSCDVSLLVVNSNELTAEHIKEIKCARVYTAFGPIDVEV